MFDEIGEDSPLAKCTQSIVPSTLTALKQSESYKWPARQVLRKNMVVFILFAFVILPRSTLRKFFATRPHSHMARPGAAAGGRGGAVAALGMSHEPLNIANRLIL